MKRFTFTLVINAERAAMHAPDFRQRFSKTREIHLRNIIETFGNRKRSLKAVESMRKITSSMSSSMSSLGKKGDSPKRSPRRSMSFRTDEIQVQLSDSDRERSNSRGSNGEVVG